MAINTIHSFRLALLVFVLVFFSCQVSAVTQPGNPKAPKRGSIVVGIEAYPKSLLFYLANEDFVQGMDDYIFDPLVAIDWETYEVIPLVAKSWKVSPDKKTYTFFLNPDAKFSDGHPLRAEDVVYTWNAIFDPKNKTGSAQALFGTFESCKAIDPLTVELKAKEKNFSNVEKLTNFYVLPKHFFEKGDFNKDFHTHLMGSGPYALSETVQGEKIVLKRNPQYWASGLPQNTGRYNFDTMVFKTYTDMNVGYEVFKRGDTDYFYFLMAKMWSTETEGPLYQNNYIKRLKIDTEFPGSMSGIAWNLRRPLFQDARVRRALSYLLNREKLLSEFFYNNYVPVTGIVASNSEYRSPKNLPIPYDPGKAAALLKEAGWTTLGSDGVLVKNGLRFEFELTLNNPGLQRVFTVYQEDLKKMGIKMNVRIVEWALSQKFQDERQFDGMTIGWTREVNPFGFARMWGSKEADVNGTDNMTGYKNPEIDKLSNLIDETFEKKKRIPLIRRVDEIIARDQPFTFDWELTYHRTAHWNKFSYVKPYLKYSLWRNAFDYWWYDADKVAKLAAAQAKGVAVSP